MGYNLAKLRKDVAVAMGQASASNGTEQIYRVRKSWKDAASQIGAYTNLEYAKAACKVGYVNSQWYAWFKVNSLSLPLSVANGGTGATTVAAARNALGLGNTSGALPIANGGTGATTAANACSNLGAVKKSGDTMTGTLTNTSTITIQRDTYPTLYYNTAAGNHKAAVICAAGAADGDGGFIIRGWNADSSAYKDLVLTYANSMAVPVSNGGTGATTTYQAVQKLFKSDNTGGITSYPTAPGIYRTTGTKVCTNSQSTLSGYGVLVIFQAVYGMHFYLDSNGTLIYGYSGDTFGQPSTWNRVTYT